MLLRLYPLIAVCLSSSSSGQFDRTQVWHGKQMTDLITKLSSQCAKRRRAEEQRGVRGRKPACAELQGSWKPAVVQLVFV
jgi:hypothetical protein